MEGRCGLPGGGVAWLAMSYELIDHTGDVGVVARAPALEALYAECARAMFDFLAGCGAPEPDGTDPFEITGAAPADDLRDFLAELLYRWSVDRKMYVSFEPGKGELRAGWEIWNPERHDLRTELKAVTYHQLVVERETDGWKAQVIFDV